VSSHPRIIALLLAGAGTLLDAQPFSRRCHAEDSLARYVPADVGLFVEAHDAGDLLIPLIEPQVWTTLAELVGQPANPADAEVWRRQIRETVKMEPAHAIRVLFSERVAFVGEGLGRAQDTVVLCRPMAAIRISDLLRIFQAQPEAGAENPKLYRLRANMGLAESDRLLVFGDLRPPDGLFRRMIRFLGQGGAGSLAEDRTYQALLRRVPEAPDGILFARRQREPRSPAWGQPGSDESAAAATATTSPSATQPGRPQPRAAGAARGAGSGLPGPLREASTILVALHRQDALLHFTAVGDASPPVRAPIADGPLLIESLPLRTLVAFEQRVNYRALAADVQRLPERHALRLAFQVQEPSGTLERLLAALDEQTCLAVGVVAATGREEEAPPCPALAWMVRVRDAERAAGEFRVAVEACTAAYALVSVSRGLPPLTPITDLSLGPVPAWLLDLGPLLPPQLVTTLGELHLCWAVHEDVLIVATHRDWLRQILEARRGAAERLTPALRLSQKPFGAGAETALVAQVGPIADVGALWMSYFERHSPEILQEAWWRGRQPGGGGVRLGIDVVEDAESHRLEVVTVQPGSPADGLLEVRDRLLGCNNQRFATSQPVEEMRSALEQRPHARWVDLLIEREGVMLVRRIPLPFVDPLQSLRRLIAIGRIAQRVVYHDDTSDASGPRGFLTVQLRSGETPLFPLPRPGSAPASQRATSANGEQRIRNTE
jgi:hypothetical protein